MEKKGNRSLIKDFITVGTGTLIYMIIGVIGTPIITRLVDPAEYGNMSMLNVYSSIGLMLCSLGLDQTMLRFFYKDDIDYQRKLVLTCCGIPVLIAGLLGAGCSVSQACGLIHLSAAEMTLLSLNVLALILNRFAHLIVRLRYHTKIHSVINILQKASYIVIAVALIHLAEGSHFVMLAIATIASSIISAVVAIVHEHDIWKFPEHESGYRVDNKELLRYGFPIMLSSSINVIFAALDKLFIDHYCSASDVGIYASAMNLMAVFTIVRTAFNTIWMPAAVEHYEREPEDKVFYKKGNAMISALMLCFGAAVVLFKDFFVLLLGSEYQEASRIVPFLMFEPIMYTISETTATGIVVQKKSQYQVIVAAGACIVNFFGNWLLTPLMGPQGAAISTGVSYIVFFCLRTYLSNKVFYVDYRLKSFFAAVVVLFLYAWYASLHSISWVDVILFLTVMGTISIVYWGSIRDLLRIVREKFSTN